MNSTSIVNYFSEFKILKTASKDFWFANAIQFFDGIALFSLQATLVLYLSKCCGFNDVNASLWVGYYTLFITAFVFAIGSICDTIGIRKSYFIGFALLIIGRVLLGFTPVLLEGVLMEFMIGVSIITMAFGTAFIGPVTQTALRRFTTKKTRATGFNIYYLIMNISSILAFAFVIDYFRKWFDEPDCYQYIMNLGIIMFACSFLCAYLMNEHNYAAPEERLDNPDAKRRPLTVLMEVWKESEFRKLVVFLVLTLGVRLVFTHQFLVMPKYYMRTIFEDFEIGFVNAFNPLIIVLGLIIIIPFINKFSTVKLMIVGMSISAFSLVFMAIPIEWYYYVPGINSLSMAYIVAIFAQVIVFAIGELLFSPRFTEYVASVAPKDKVASYMALSALPMFIAKPINGFIAGILVTYLSYDGIRAKLDVADVHYFDSPEFMWAIYLALAVLSPIAIVLMKDRLTHDTRVKPDIEAEESMIAANNSEFETGEQESSPINLQPTK